MSILDDIEEFNLTVSQQVLVLEMQDREGFLRAFAYAKKFCEANQKSDLQEWKISPLSIQPYPGEHEQADFLEYKA